MNLATVKVLPGKDWIGNRPVQLTNFAGTVTLELSAEGFYLVLPNQRKPLEPEQLSQMLAVWFAETNTEEESACL